MNVLMVHSSDYGWGGGQTAMNRLQSGLLRAGVEARILCKKATREGSITVPAASRWEPWIKRVTSRIGLNDVHHVSAFNIRHTAAYARADVLDFHAIHGGFFSYLALPTLTAGKPAIFTLHDMWPFTGHCHNSRDCERWRTGCGRCPYPETEPAIRRDVSHLEWWLKKKLYQRSHLTIVAPSTWLTALAQQSTLGHFPVHHIPYGLDTEVYQPLDRDQCRVVLGLPPKKRVLLFAVDDLRRYLKGADLLQKALHGVPASLRADMVLLLFGNGGEAFARTVDIPAYNLGYIGSDRLKAACYSAADLLVSPTRADNLPLIVIESLACGTPVVSFRINGVPDLVRPGLTGYLAEPEDASDLARGIVRLLDDRPLLQSMQQHCRQIAVQEFALHLQVERYMALYRQVLDKATVAPIP
jgi:glycosyltransferase involved in cell wall biosynthesis